MVDSPARAVFRYRNFRCFMPARFLVTFATEMQAIAVAWQVYAITHRPLDLGLVGLAQFVPGIALFLVAGHAADRFPRNRILAVCYAGFAVCSTLFLLLSLRGLAAVWPLYVVLVLNGTVRAFNGPASQAFLPLLVPKALFPTAVAWGSSVFQTATILGPIAGGFIYGFANSPLPVYFAAAIGYLAALAAISIVHVKNPPRAPAGALAMVLEGVRYIWRNKLVLGAMSLDLFAVLLGGAIALLPVYAREILHVGPNGLGLLRSAPGAGAVLMAVVVAHWPLRRRAGAAMLSCVFLFGGFTIVFGISRNISLSVAALALVGAVDMISVVVRHTLVQLTTPDKMRGRVSAVNTVFIGASNEVGQFESGVTAQWFGSVPAVVLGGLGTIVVVLLWAWLFPELRRVDKLVPEPAPEPASLES
jgi:MFS family permease